MCLLFIESLAFRPSFPLSRFRCSCAHALGRWPSDLVLFLFCRMGGAVKWSKGAQRSKLLSKALDPSQQQSSGPRSQAAFQFVKWPLAYFGCSLDDDGKVALPMPGPAEG